MRNRETIPHVALTIAGLDPSGGAGVLADIRTFATFGCFPTAVITSLTFQNTTRVFGVQNQTAEVVRQQTLPIISDFTVAGAKTGMLPTSEVIAEVARMFREEDLPAPVVDPVMQATSGDSLIDDEAVETLVRDLFPLARLVTPNIPEAERLTGRKIRNQRDMAEAARIIRELGARAVLIKGGHAQESWHSSAENGSEAVDLLDDEGRITVVSELLVVGIEVHGSGCTLSAAIAANLAQGRTLEESVRTAKHFVTELIRSSPQLGHGAKPLFKVSESSWK
jgi:hydroxymethylpyrimidine kinase/phosphomethylpyrimidine kinase